MRKEDFEKALSDLVNTEDLEDIFGVSRQALFRWRMERGLDEFEVRIPNRPRDIIRFRLNLVLRWAARNSVATPGLELWRKRRARRDANAA